MSRKEVKQAINEIREKGIRNADDYAVYRKRKLHAQYLEQSNVNKIVVFPSVDPPWYKVGWNSALFYAYDIGMIVCKKKNWPVIRKDTDLETRSPEGIVFIKDIDKLVERLKTANIDKYEVTDDGLYIFQLKKEYTKSDIKEFKNTYHRKNSELFDMIARAKPHPELRGLIVQAMKAIFPKTKKLPGVYANSVGLEMNNSMIKMNRAYFDFANKRTTSKECFIEIVRAANNILADLAIISENDMWNPIEFIEVGGIMVDIKATVARIMKKQEKNA